MHACVRDMRAPHHTHTPTAQTQRDALGSVCVSCVRAQISDDPLKVHIEHLRDEQYVNDDILKVSQGEGGGRHA